MTVRAVPKSLVLSAKCLKCGTHLHYDQVDIKREEVHDDRSRSFEVFVHIKCPVCQCKVFVNGK